MAAAPCAVGCAQLEPVTGNSNYSLALQRNQSTCSGDIRQLV